MNTVDLLKNHRSIRKFTDEPVTDEMVESIIRAGLSSATSSNLQGATVIRVRDPEKRTAIATLAGGQSYVETAGAFFVWCADLHRSSVACEMAEGSFVPGVTEHFIIAVVDCAIADLAQMTELLELPDQVVPLFGMCIGWPDQDPDRRPRLFLSV